MFKARIALWSGIVTLAAGMACGSGQSGEVVIDEELRAQLIWMAEEDDDLRSRVIGAENPNMDYMQQLKESEVEQSAKLREILEQHGWPDADMVGPQGAQAAWTLLKHGDVELKELGLRLVRESENPGVAATDIAVMTDAVLVERGEPQLYGTQFTMVHGKLVQHPVDNADSVDARRARVGFPPIDEYLQMLQGAHGMGVERADPHQGMVIVPQQPDTVKGDR